MGMPIRRTPGVRRSRAVLVLPLALILSSCAGAVTESDEYLALQAELDDTAGQLESTEARASAAETELESVNASLATAETTMENNATELAGLEESLEEAEEARDEAAAALDAEINRPWPDPLKDVFLAGCTESPGEEFTAEQNRAVCECIITELEESVTFVDFMTFSMLAFTAADAEVDSFTGLPRGLDRDFADALITASTTCVLEL